ncbi:hypothetical protein HRbin39_01729 [bacterium HR39]|nr:hypothetical protein HRbin39_01729 [bacterium HR39]
MARKVEIDARAPLLAPRLQRGEIGPLLHHPLGEPAGEGAHIREAGSAAQRHDDVEAARAGGAHEAGAAAPAQEIHGRARHPPGPVEAFVQVHSLRRVEIDHQQIGRERRVAAHRPGMEGDGVLPDPEDQVGHLLDGGVLAAAAVGERHLGAGEPGRRAGRQVPLPEAGPEDAAGKALDGDGPIAQVGQQEGSDGDVVFDQMPLGDAVVGEQHPVGVGEHHLDAVEFQHRPLAHPAAPAVGHPAVAALTGCG